LEALQLAREVVSRLVTHITTQPHV
jgi:hypothetical protein